MILCPLIYHKKPPSWTGGSLGLRLLAELRLVQVAVSNVGERVTPGKMRTAGSGLYDHLVYPICLYIVYSPVRNPALILAWRRISVIEPDKSPCVPFELASIFCMESSFAQVIQCRVLLLLLGLASLRAPYVMHSSESAAACYSRNWGLQPVPTMPTMLARCH